MQDNWQVLGHHKIIDFLQTSLAKNKLASAYLFHGPDQVGKVTVAKKFIENIVGSSRLATNCHILEREPDKKDISINQIRDWQRLLQLTSFDQGLNAGLIIEAERMSLEAANALLKTIEEPQANTVIILTTVKQTELLPTIVSRCQNLRFSDITDEAMKEFLKDKKVEQSDWLLKMAQGKSGILMKLMGDEDFLASQKQETQEIFELLHKNSQQRLAWLENYLVEAESLVEKNSQARILLKKLASVFKPNPINYHFFEKLLQAETNLKTNVQPKIVLENLLLEL